MTTLLLRGRREEQVCLAGQRAGWWWRGQCMLSLHPGLQTTRLDQPGPAWSRTCKLSLSVQWESSESQPSQAQPSRAQARPANSTARRRNWVTQPPPHPPPPPPPPPSPSSPSSSPQLSSPPPGSSSWAGQGLPPEARWQQPAALPATPCTLACNCYHHDGSDDDDLDQGNIKGVCHLAWRG